MEGRTEKMCYSRYRRLMAEARQRWAPQEEQKLINLVEQKGEQWKEFIEYFPSKDFFIQIAPGSKFVTNM